MSFSDEYLDDEFKSINVKLANELVGRDDISFEDDDVEMWACGIVFAVGQLNFLFDGLYHPHITRDDVCGYFAVGRINANNKARDIRRILNLKLGIVSFQPNLF